jgi:high-affinity Fe2+/Pb2+ permease
MKKLLFYISIIISLRLAYIIYDIVVYQLETLNDYGVGFLVGKIILLLVLILVIYKTNPLKKQVQKL